MSPKGSIEHGLTTSQDVAGLAVVNGRGRHQTQAGMMVLVVRRSTRGLKNHGWKDSDEAIRYPDGSLVENPIATVEEQAYHWVAMQRMAEILLALEDDRGAEEFAAKASRIRRKEREQVRKLAGEFLFGCAVLLQVFPRSAGSVAADSLR